MIRKGLAASAILIVLMLALSLWAMPHLAPDGQFATHWNLNGQADRYGSRTMVLWFMPGLAIGLAALLAVFPFIDPRRKNLQRSSLPYLVSWIGAFVVLGFAHMMMVLNAAGSLNLADVSSGPGLLRWISILVGGFFALLGAVMGKIRPNWFIGVRTPWTLSSDLSWDKTHRLAGWLFMLTGLATVMTAWLMIPRWALVVLIGGTLVSGLVAVGYSFLVWKSDLARETLVPDDAD
jgi:immunity protein, SdpI family